MKLKGLIDLVPYIIGFDELFIKIKSLKLSFYWQIEIGPKGLNGDWIISRKVGTVPHLSQVGLYAHCTNVFRVIVKRQLPG